MPKSAHMRAEDLVLERRDLTRKLLGLVTGAPRDVVVIDDAHQ
jgi:hypothetical protein